MADKPAAPATGPATGTGAANADALDALDAALADDPAAAAAEEWTAPTREEWQAQQDEHKAALEAEKAKLQRARTQAERLRKEKGEPTAAAAATATDGAPAADAAATARLAALEQRAVAAERKAVVAAARVKLGQRGADADLLDLAVSRLNVADVTFDGDEPDLDAWLDEMEEKYPKLFAKPDAAQQGAGRQPVGTVNQGAAVKHTPRKLSFGEQVLAASKAKR